MLACTKPPYVMMDTCGMMFGKTIWTSLITWALSPSLGNVVGAVGAGTLVTMSECFENVSPMAFRFKKLGATAFTRSMKDDRPAMYGRDLRASVARMTPFTRRARSDSWTGSARLAYRCLLLTEPAMSLGSTGRGSPISISVLHSRGPAASPFSLSSSFTSAPKRRRAPVSAAMSTSFTEQPCLLRICCTSDISTGGNRARARLPLNFRYGVRSERGGLMLSSESGLANAATPKPRAKWLAFWQQPGFVFGVSTASLACCLGLPGSSAAGKGILPSGSPPSQPHIGDIANSSPSPSPIEWCILM
mmetsp:Transcript_100921/g.263146  ORF Transcript_100921/g.263146 Transcript_100921/m.263146 type:complete len:304 (+) Transcript_100921:404-1315(+)